MDLYSTKGGATANSYADIDDADDYIESIYGAEGWKELTDTEKEQLLMTASKAINRLHVKFSKATVAQELPFPAHTYGDTELGDGFDQAKEATILQALYLLKHHDELQEAQGDWIQAVTAKRVGQVSQTQGGYNPVAKIAPEALQIMAPYVDLRVRAVR